MKRNKLKRYLAGAFALAVALAWLWLAFFFREPAEFTEQKSGHACIVALQRMGTAMLLYRQEHGTPWLPPDLDILAERGFLPKEALLPCRAGVEPAYVYLKGLREDMPENIPVVVRPKAPHVHCMPDGSTRNYGRVLYLDSSIQSFLAEDLGYALAQAESALEIMRSADGPKIVSVLRETGKYTFLEQAAALWKWRQDPGAAPRELLFEYFLGYLSTGAILRLESDHALSLENGRVSGAVRGKFAERGYSLSPQVEIARSDGDWFILDQRQRKEYRVIREKDGLGVYIRMPGLGPGRGQPTVAYYHDPRPAARQAAYLWLRMNREIAEGEMCRVVWRENPSGEAAIWQFLSQDLRHPEYSIRRRTWRMFFPEAATTPLDLSHPEPPPEILPVSLVLFRLNSGFDQFLFPVF